MAAKTASIGFLNSYLSNQAAVEMNKEIISAMFNSPIAKESFNNGFSLLPVVQGFFLSHIANGEDELIESNTYHLDSNPPKYIKKAQDKIQELFDLSMEEKRIVMIVIDFQIAQNKL